MVLVISVDFLHRVHHVIHRPEHKQTFVAAQELAEAGILHNDRFTRSQIGGRAVAEPAATRFHVSVFGNTEFAARIANVFEIGFYAQRCRERFRNDPAGILQLLRRKAHAAERNLEYVAQALGKVEEVEHFDVLLPVGDAFVLDASIGRPTHHGREPLGFWCKSRLDQVKSERLAKWMPVQPVCRDRAVWFADAFAKREVEIEIVRRRVAGAGGVWCRRHFELRESGVDIDEDAGAAVTKLLDPRGGRGTHQKRRFATERFHLVWLQPVPLAGRIHVTPAAQADAFEEWQNLAQAIRRVVAHGVRARVVTRVGPTMVFDEDDLVTEFGEACEKVILRQQMPAEWIAGEVTRKDGDGSAHAVAFMMRSARTLRASNISAANACAAPE